MKKCSAFSALSHVVLIIEFVDEILWTDQSYQTLSVVLVVPSHGAASQCVLLTSESVGNILWCYHSNETPWVKVSLITIYFLRFFK